jgi:serine/threonine protein kinase
MGTAILRRYVLMDPVGQGGVSTVYQAVDARRGQLLAVKVLAPLLAGDPKVREDVRREALITDAIRHPGVPRVYEYGDAPLPDGTVVPYVAMELLAGTPLTDRLADGPLPWPEAVRIAATAADVLAVAHRRGIVHRDLAPRNILIAPSGMIKIIDFGLATQATRSDTGARPIVVRRPRVRQRPPAHPLTAAAQPADDVYHLGVLLYELVTGRSPYPRSSSSPLLLGGRPVLAPTPVVTVPGVPGDVAEVIRACMAKRPGDRPSASAAALRLWEIADGAAAPATSGRQLSRLG